MANHQPTYKNRLIILSLGIVLIVTIIVSFLLGRYPIAPSELIGMILSKVFHIEPYWTETMEAVLFNIRLPRIMLACLVGCSLSTAGASYQGIFQNPMASPDILGASAGAAFGAALAILRSGSSTMITMSAFIFSLLTVAIVYIISKRQRAPNCWDLFIRHYGQLAVLGGHLYIKLVANPYRPAARHHLLMMGSLPEPSSGSGLRSDTHGSGPDPSSCCAGE